MKDRTNERKKGRVQERDGENSIANERDKLMNYKRSYPYFARSNTCTNGNQVISDGKYIFRNRSKVALFFSENLMRLLSVSL